MSDCTLLHTVAADFKQDTTPAMNSLTSSAAALVESITRTSHMESKSILISCILFYQYQHNALNVKLRKIHHLFMQAASTTVPTHPHPTLDTVSSKGQITSSQSIRSTPRKGINIF